MSSLIKTRLPSKFPRNFQDKQTTAKLNIPVTSNYTNATNGNLFGNPVFIKEEISCLANFCA